MKKAIFTLLAGLPAVAFAQAPAPASQAFTVKGNIGHIGAPAKAYLNYGKNGKGVVDSAVIVDGKFELKGSVDYPTQATLFVNRAGTGIRPPYDYTPVYLEKGVITVTSADSAKKATITGTQTNADNVTYKALYKPISERYAAFYGKQKAATPEQQESAAFKKEMEALETSIDQDEAAFNKQFVKAHPSSFISLNLIRSLAYGSDYPEIEPLYASLSPEIKTTAPGKQFAETLAKLKNVAIGKIAPEFAQNDANGKSIALSSFRGKYLLIDFWASWCGPCRAENPNVVKAFNKYKDKNFTILGVSLDRPTDKDKWLAAIEKDGLTWTQVSDLKYWNNEASQAYGVQAIPQNFLLDPNGKIIGKNLRGEALNKKLEEIFGKGETPKAE